LLVHHPNGLEVVECKHWPSGTVGRPVVQKLHSAVLTAKSNSGTIITTGRFSSDAETYARNLNDINLQLIDAAKLDYMISLAFPNGALPSKLLGAIKTTPDAEFPQVFAESIFSRERYQSGKAPQSPVRVIRTTEYHTYYIARYHADGSVNTAVGEYCETWDGSIWISANGDEAGFGSPRSHGEKLGPLVPLAEILKTVPGKSAPPRLQPHQAVGGMKQFLVNHCVKTVSYRGRNNVSYSAAIRASPNRIVIDSLKLCYVPHQEFMLQVEGVRYEGQVDECGSSPPQFHVTCSALSECSVCGTATTADNQILCSICFRPAHRWRLFSPDSFQCEKCGTLVCRNHTVHISKQVTCSRCGAGGRPLRARWFGHFLFGLGGSGVVALVTLIILFCLVHFGSGTGRAAMVVFVIGCILALAVWVPFFAIVSQGSVLPKYQMLAYPKVLDARSPLEPTNRPDWLYGKTS
jgi:restriction system protein